MARRPDECGQVTPLMAAALALALLALLALAPVGRAVVDRAQARTAADAAALAGAAEGRTAAARLADANGAELVDYDEVDGSVVVEVRIGSSAAYARAGATRRPAAAPNGRGVRAGLTPALVAALARADRLLGGPVPVVSGYRSREQQEHLWARRATNPYPVARPGMSRHELGLAIDVPRHFVGELLRVAAAAGLCQPLPRSDPVHFELCLGPDRPPPAGWSDAHQGWP